MQFRPHGSLDTTLLGIRGRPQQGLEGRPLPHGPVSGAPSFPQLQLHPQPPPRLLWPAHSKGSGPARSLALLSSPSAETRPMRQPPRASRSLFSKTVLCVTTDSRQRALGPAGGQPNATTEGPWDPGKLPAPLCLFPHGNGGAHSRPAGQGQLDEFTHETFRTPPGTWQVIMIVATVAFPSNSTRI